MDFLKSESFILPAIPVLAFIGSYIFEMGYADQFGYPHELIDLDLKAIVIAIFCSFILLIPAYAYYYIFLAIFVRPEKEFRYIGASLLFAFPGVAMVYIAGLTNTFMNYLLGVCFLMGAIPLVLALARHRTLDWKKAFNAAATEAGYKEVKTRFGDDRTLSTRDKVYAAIIYCFIAIIFAMMIRGAGTITANWKTNYHTFIWDGHEVAILASYGDRLILGGISDETFNKRIFVIPRNSDQIKDIQSAQLKEFLRRL